MSTKHGPRKTSDMYVGVETKDDCFLEDDQAGTMPHNQMKEWKSLHVQPFNQNIFTATSGTNLKR